MTPDQDKRLLSAKELKRAREFLNNSAPNTTQKVFDHIAALTDQLAAQAQPSEQVRELVAACQQLLCDEDECYEPGKCIVTASAMQRIKAALAPSTETSDAQH